MMDRIGIQIRSLIREGMQFILRMSLKEAAKEQGLSKLVHTLATIVPDITDQYSTIQLDNPYLKENVRNLHAFQISLVNNILKEFERPVIVDIGDSAGNHLIYILELFSKSMHIQCLSVNLDANAINKIRQKGLKAIITKAENLENYNINADIFLCFETLEHLSDPCHFLYGLSNNTEAKYLIVTVPYVQKSRVGLHHIRREIVGPCCAENTHIFELNPDDWKLLLKHSGWDVVHEKIYLQYPKKGIIRLTRFLWKRYDFEGYLGLILLRNDTWSSKYLDW
jgi:2-polyprenyl-3-methyl-5-hydroxy-6-metoxy-1,4-benzoquinol methylase